MPVSFASFSALALRTKKEVGLRFGVTSKKERSSSVGTYSANIGCFNLCAFLRRGTNNPIQNKGSSVPTGGERYWGGDRVWSYEGGRMSKSLRTKQLRWPLTTSRFARLLHFCSRPPVPKNKPSCYPWIECYTEVARKSNTEELIDGSKGWTTQPAQGLALSNQLSAVIQGWVGESSLNLTRFMAATSINKTYHLGSPGSNYYLIEMGNRKKKPKAEWNSSLGGVPRGIEIRAGRFHSLSWKFR